jgi:hypothetical protein
MLNKLISGFPPELQLMLSSVNSDLDKTEHLFQKPINWDKFLRLADHHRVSPSVYSTLSRLDSMTVPEHILNALRQTCQENTLSALRITGETVRIIRLLENNNISAVVLKGAPLSCRLYGDIAARPYDDIDMLVTSEKLEQAIAILENEGYRRISEYDSYNLTPRQLQIYLKHHEHSSHFKYWNSRKRVLIEIHWKLSKDGNELQYSAEGDIKKMVVAGNPLPVLSDEEWLLYLVLHGVGHKWHRLRWLVDIKRFIQQENIDWVNLDRQADKFGIQTFLHQTLILVNQVFEVALPPVLEPDITSNKTAWRMAYLALQAYILDAGDQFGSSGIYLLFVNNYYGFYMNKGLKNKFNYVLKLFRPTVENIKHYIMGIFKFTTRCLHRLVVRNKHVST